MLTLRPEHTQYVHNGSPFYKVNKAINGLKGAGLDFYFYLSRPACSPRAAVALSLTPFFSSS